MTTKDIDYIQFFLNDKEMDEVTAPFLAYKESKAATMNRISFQTYKQMMIKRFENDEESVAQYLQLARKFVNNKNFESALSNAVDNLAMPEYTNMKVFAMQDYLTKNAQEYQKLVNEVTAAVTSITDILGIADLSAIMPGTKAYDILQKIYNDQGKDFDRIITLSQHKDLDARFAGQYKYLLSLLQDFQNVQDSGDRGAAVQILGKLLVPIQTLIGICNEYQVELEVNKLLSDMAKDLNSPNIQVTRVGDESDKLFSTGTADLKASMNIGHSNVEFKVPDLGMSLKRSHKNLDSAKEVKIKLKTGAKLGNLMAGIMDPKLVTQFYTIYANTQPMINGNRQKALPAGTISSAYALMKAKCLIPALIGNINSDDLVAIFIINNKPYTIFDMLEAMADATSGEEGGTGVIMEKLSFTAGRKIAQGANQYIENDPTGWTRSKAVRNAIDSISTNIYLRLRLADLRGL